MSADGNLAEIGKVLDAARRAAVKYKKLTGKPLGITGEIAEFEAARILGLKLTEARHEGFDGWRGNERIQIKGRVVGPDAKPGQRLGRIRLDKEWDSVVLVLMNEDFQPLQIYEAEREAIEKVLKTPGSKSRNERGQMGVSKFKSIGRLAWEAVEGRSG